MNARKFVYFLGIVMLVLFFSMTCFGEIQSHESLPYKIIFLNNSSSSPLLLSAKVDLKKGCIKVEYRPSSGKKELTKVYIAEVVNDYNGLKLLGNSMFEFSPLGEGENTKSIDYANLKLKRGMILVIWTNNANENLSIQRKREILGYAKILLGEQERLTEISIYKGNDELLNEVTTNYEE